MGCLCRAGYIQSCSRLDRSEQSDPSSSNLHPPLTLCTRKLRSGEYPPRGINFHHVNEDGRFFSLLETAAFCLLCGRMKCFIVLLVKKNFAMFTLKKRYTRRGLYRRDAHGVSQCCVHVQYILCCCGGRRSFLKLG